MYRLSLFFTSNGRKDILPVLVLFLSLSCTQFWYLSTPTFRSSRSQLFFEIGAFKNFAIFTGNHLRWSLQEVPAQAFSCEFCEQFLLESTSSGCFCTFPRLLQIVTISNFNLSLSKWRLVKKTSRDVTNTTRPMKSEAHWKFYWFFMKRNPLIISFLYTMLPNHCLKYRNFT